MDTCFVIQPFDKGKFDKRYKDIFEPAITEAGMTPYRVDKDPSVRIPIEEIEKGIRDSQICFAEITTDNPNVWYELGYAFACNKEVILVCQSHEREKFPFDIQHRSIIKYESTSTSDFEGLKQEIVKKIKAVRKRQTNVETLISMPIKESEGLKPHEATLLLTIFSAQVVDESSVSVYSLQSDMEKAGFTKAAFSLALRSLKRKDMIDTAMVNDAQYNEPYPVCSIKRKGEDWIMENQDIIELKEKKSSDADDIPF